jgi:hypothetical protein
MTITIDLAPELERQLRQAAADAGVALDSFIIRSVEAQLGTTARTAENGPRLSPGEAELLLKINDLLASFPWERYHELITNRQDESLTANEQVQLAALADQIEAANVHRMALLAELAQLRKISVPALMAELGLRPPSP